MCAKIDPLKVVDGGAEEPARRHDLAAPQQGTHVLQMRRRAFEFEFPGLIGADEGPTALRHVLDPHGRMKPIQDMLNRRICRAANRSRKRGISVTEDDDIASRQPALRFHRGANDFMLRTGNIRHCREMRRRSALRLDAAHQHLKMPRLISGNGADICAVDEYRNGLGAGAAHAVGRLETARLDVIGDLSEPGSDPRVVVLADRWHENIHDPGSFAKGMTRAELGQHMIELGGCSIGEGALGRAGPSSISDKARSLPSK